MKKTSILTTITFISAIVVAIIGFLSIFMYTFLTQVRPHCEKWVDDQNNRPDEFYVYDPDYADFDTEPYFMATYETVSFPSRDENITLNAYWIPAEDPDAPVMVVTHGNNDCNKVGWTLIVAGMFHRNGYNVLMPDLRNMGDSDSDDGRNGSGGKEYQDVLGAWDWLIEAQGFSEGEIGLHGLSLGAATTIIAMAEEPRVAAAWSTSAFSNIDRVVDHRITELGLPEFVKPVVAFPLFAGRLITGFDVRERTPLTEITRIGDRPLMIMHSVDDPSIEIIHAEELRDALIEAGYTPTTWFVEGSIHGRAIFDYTEEYEERMMTFFAEHLASEASTAQN